MKQTNFEIVRAQAEDAAALLEYLKIIGGETDNLSFGPEGVPLDVEAEQSYLNMQAQSHDHIQLLAKVNGEIIGTASLNRKLCTFPGFFKINGELIDFDLMNLDLCPAAQSNDYTGNN